MIALLEFALASWAHFLGTLCLIAASGWALGQVRLISIHHHND
jgi:hypothetical protein